MKARFAKVMVPLNGHESDKAAVELACRLAKSIKGKVHVVHVIRVSRALPLDAELEPEIKKAEELFRQAEDMADSMGCPIQTELLQSREIGPALVDEAMQQGVDLMLISIEQGNFLGEFMLDHTSSYVLKNAPCSVCLLHYLPPK